MTLQAFEIPLPDYARSALDVLERGGFEAWAVGGCVRDSLLGREVHDYDIATSAPWPQTQRLFQQAGWTTHDVGAKHGTVTAVRDGNALEVTTYRADGAYSDGRHPDQVRFVNSIEEDLARRDFTMNALAYHPERGLLDCFGGKDDLQSGTIRAIGDPFDRFQEDALRVLRGCRFASQLGFAIEPATYAAMIKQKTLVLGISRERVTHEFQELLLGTYVHDALMATVDVLSAVVPELQAAKGFEQHSPYHIYDVFEHIAYVVQNTPAYPLVRWAALLHDIGKPGAYFSEDGVGHFFGHARVGEIMAHGILERFTLSPAFRNRVVTLVRIHDDVIGADARSVRRALLSLDGDVELFRALCDLKLGDALSQSERCAPRLQIARDLPAVLDAVLAADEAFSVRHLAVNGHDIVALGVQPGPRVGALLRTALDAVVDGDVPNEREALMAYLETQR